MQRQEQLRLHRRNLPAEFSDQQKTRKRPLLCRVTEMSVSKVINFLCEQQACGQGLQWSSLSLESGCLETAI